MRRTDRAVRRGTSSQVSDRTAGDSSPVTQERPAPGTPGAGRRKSAQTSTGKVREHVQARAERLRCPGPSSTMPTKPKSPRRQPHRLCPPALPEVETNRAPRLRRGADPGTRGKRRNPPAPLPGTGAALTPVLTKEGPRGSVPRGPSPRPGPAHLGAPCVRRGRRSRSPAPHGCPRCGRTGPTSGPRGRARRGVRGELRVEPAVVGAAGRVAGVPVVPQDGELAGGDVVPGRVGEFEVEDAADDDAGHLGRAVGADHRVDEGVVGVDGDGGALARLERHPAAHLHDVADRPDLVRVEAGEHRQRVVLLVRLAQGGPQPREDVLLLRVQYVQRRLGAFAAQCRRVEVRGDQQFPGQPKGLGDLRLRPSADRFRLRCEDAGLAVGPALGRGAGERIVQGGCRGGRGGRWGGGGRGLLGERCPGVGGPAAEGVARQQRRLQRHDGHDEGEEQTEDRPHPPAAPLVLERRTRTPALGRLAAGLLLPQALGHHAGARGRLLRSLPLVGARELFPDVVGDFGGRGGVLGRLVRHDGSSMG